MLKKYILAALLLAAPCIGMATDHDMKFVDKRSGVTHVLQVKNWRVDAKGVPSFDYAYSQQGAGCRYEVAGRAVAGYEEAGGKIEYEVYNPQGADGSETQILLFHDGMVNFTLDRKRMEKFTSISFDTTIEPAARKSACNKQSERVEVSFKTATRKQ